MSDGGSADPGWYTDPHQPSRLRYWDGNVWTDHYSSDNDGSLPSIGDWIGNTFSAIAAYGIPALALAVGAGLALSAITYGGLWWAVGDGQVVNEDFVGDWVPIAIRAGVVMLVLILAQGLVWLAVSRFMQRAHLQAEPTIGEALQHAFKRLPRFIGVSLMVGLAAVVLFVVVIALLGLVGTASEGLGIGLAVIVGLASLVGLVFVWVKLSFLSAAVIAAPTSESVLRSSAGVSKGRFWPVLGRLLLLTIGVAILSSIVSTVTGGLSQPFDANVFVDVFEQDGDVVTINDFAFRDFLPTGTRVVAYLILSSIINAASGLISTSASMRLYLDSGAPSEV